MPNKKVKPCSAGSKSLGKFQVAGCNGNYYFAGSLWVFVAREFAGNFRSHWLQVRDKTSL